MISCPYGRYVVNGAITNGASRANEGFATFNAYLVFNTNYRRMELRLAGPAEPGTYEALTNYDTPHQPPGYWSRERWMRLPPDSQRLCDEYYPPGLPRHREAKAPRHPRGPPVTTKAPADPPAANIRLTPPALSSTLKAPRRPRPAPPRGNPHHPRTLFDWWPPTKDG